jgi:hypothetical protein
MLGTCWMLGVALDIAVGAPLLRRVAAGALIDPDSYIRLVRLRDILAAHAPLQAVARDASGSGTVLAWSHLLDSLLLLLALPLECCLTETGAIRWAGIALGPIGVGSLCAATAWAFAPVTAPDWRWTTPILACISAPIAAYGVPGVVHHHILIALACVMTAGLAARVLRHETGGRQAGAWAAFGLWLTPEGMPFVLMAFGLLWVAWITQGPGAAGRELRAAATVLLLLVAAIVAVDPPAGGPLAADIDRVSIVYVAMALALAMLGWGVCMLDRRPLSSRLRMGLGTAIALMLAGAWLAIFPRVILGPAGLPDPASTQLMLAGIQEMRPVSTPGDALLILGSGALGAAVVLAVALRRRTLPWAYGALCAIALITLGAMHRRFATYSAVMGAGILPMAITLSGQRLSCQSDLLRAADRVALLALFLLTPTVGRIAAIAAQPADVRPDCSIRTAQRLLAPYARRVVLADVDETPELLYRTDVLTVGSLYHRNAAAFLRLRAAWRSTDLANEPPSLRATGAAAILICPDYRAQPLAATSVAPSTLRDRLDHGQPPDWLQLAGHDESGYVLYRILPSSYR